MSVIGIVLLSVSAILIITALFVVLPSLWFRAIVSGAHVPLIKILKFGVEGLNARAIVNAYIKARRHGVDITIEQIENHVLAKGDIENVVNACVTAKNAGVNLSVRVAMAIDLSGRDINDAVRTAITPRMIETPVITTVCKNGTEISASAKITIKTNLQRLIGGLQEDAIIARVSEGISACIGSALNHYELLEKPDAISHQLMQRNFSTDSAFDVLSIDIAKMEIGRSVKAEEEPSSTLPIEFSEALENLTIDDLVFESTETPLTHKKTRLA